MSGHRPWREVRSERLAVMTPEERAEAEAAYELAREELNASLIALADGLSDWAVKAAAPRICGHCGHPRRGYGFANGVDLCHTGTLAPDAEPMDCFRLVQIYQHAADGSCCR